MAFDLSEKGREEFYREFFKNVESAEREKLPDDAKYRIISVYINNLKSYESLRESYKKQLNDLWGLVKRYSIIVNSEERELGVITKDTQNLEDKITKFRENLNNLSTTFEQDMNKIINNDPKIRRIPGSINPN